MAYDEELARRVRRLASDEAGLSEQRMFGGLALLIHGNMAVAASGQGGLLVRVHPDQTAEFVSTTRATAMEMRGRPMRGWLRVESEHVATERDLLTWVDRGISYARSLEPKR